MTNCILDDFALLEAAPTLKLPKGRVKGCAVYLASANKAIKIGMTDAPRKRMGSLATGSPENLVILHYWTLPSRQEAAALEAELHRLFAWCKKSREWFDTSAQRVKTAGDILLSGGNPRPIVSMMRRHDVIQSAVFAAEKAKRDCERLYQAWMRAHARLLRCGFPRHSWDHIR